MYPSAMAVFATAQHLIRKCYARLACAIIVCGLAGTVSAAAPSAERHLAPGVLTTIAPNLNPEDTVSTHDIMEIRADSGVKWKPEYIPSSDTLFGMSDKAKFRREIYGLEFSFKPLRMMEGDVPIAGARTERKLVWYLVYGIRNTGQTLKPVQGQDGVYSTEIAK